MGTLQDLFSSKGATFFSNENIALDKFFLDPYQDANNDWSDHYDITTIYEDLPQKKKKKLPYGSTGYSLFSFFMDGTRRTYKIGDLLLPGRKIFPVITAQVRAGCIHRNGQSVAHHQIESDNYLLISSNFNDLDFEEISVRIQKSKKVSISLSTERYSFDKVKDSSPTNAAIAKVNSLMHKLEISILKKMVYNRELKTDKMLVVDGPLQFIAEDNGKDAFADLFYNVVGVSKSFDPNLSISEKRGGPHIGAQLLTLDFGERTPVFYKRNSKGREFGFWYLRIHPKKHIRNPLEGIIKIEKMATKEDRESGLSTDAVDSISLSLLLERNPTCHGRDQRWPSHIYPVYLAETYIKSTYHSDEFFINQFNRDIF